MRISARMLDDIISTQGDSTMKRMITGLFAALLLAFSSAGAADTYALDKSHSDVSFTVRHMVISKVRGAFEDYSVELKLDAQDLSRSSVSAVFQVASINTADAKRDEHLRAEDFFDAATYPTMTFVSKSIERRGSDWVAVGDFTLRGVTRSIELPFTLNGPITDPWGNQRVGVETAIKINRQDYGLSWSKTLDAGGLVVDDTVDIVIHLEAVKQ
jgi:polyisoprenoid-binding protein YceI